MRTSKKIKTRFWLEGAGLTLAFAWLFYQSVWGLLSGLLLIPFWAKEREKEVRKKESIKENMEFKDAMMAVSEALKVGYSIENAFVEAEKELVHLHGEHTFMVKELRKINKQVQLNEPVEKLLEEFGERTGESDIISFCQVFVFAKRSGGNFTKIIERSIRQIEEKVAVSQEIETLVAEKRFEQKIMNLMPLIIILYLKISSFSFLEILYHNILGVMIMTAGLFIYLLAYYLGNKITTIEI